jgi:hypothetical protein
MALVRVSSSFCVGFQISAQSCRYTALTHGKWLDKSQHLLKTEGVVTGEGVPPLTAILVSRWMADDS